jgi:UDP-3-O-[3-hydroxymyristoyl] glucosamine N-acyltransferase
MRVQDIIDRLGGECVGDDSLEVIGVNAAADARPREVTFAATRRYLAAAEASSAAVVVLPPSLACARKTVIRTPQVEAYVAELIGLLHPPEPPPAGIHPTAVIAQRVELGQRVSVGARAVVEPGCRVGDDCVLGAGVFLGRDSTVGAGTRIDPNVTVYHRTTIGRRVVIHGGAVIGAEGFRFVPTAAGAKRIPHIGRVRIDDDVEIGANTCIDRATFGVTHLQAGVKVDNLVQVGHNCSVGAGSILVGQCGLAGSVTTGRGVIIAGQAGISDHLHVGDGARVGGQSGVLDDVPPGQQWVGYPARPRRDFKKERVLVRKLLKMYHALRDLVEKRTHAPRGS